MVGLSRQTACFVDLVRKPRCYCQQLRIKAKILLTQCSTSSNDDSLSFLNQTFKDWKSFVTRHKTNDSHIYFLFIKSGIMKYDVHFDPPNGRFEPHKALRYTTQVPTLKNSTFCQQSEFVWFLWCLQQTAIFFSTLHNATGYHDDDVLFTARYQLHL